MKKKRIGIIALMLSSALIISASATISYASYGTETYYGQALLKLYEGGEYKPLTVTRTPSMTKPTRSSMANNNQETQDKDAIFVNENGYTMGNATTEDYAEIRDLDFYSAIGVNGKKGYIRASEMNGPKTLDEAATYDDSSKDIPVYASDGVTVIDTFHIYGPEESSSTDTMVAATSLTE